MQTETVPTRPYRDQKPGTAGLRKPIVTFRQPHYLENFVQAVFDTVPTLSDGPLVIGGDGRYFNREAIHTIVCMAAANGVSGLVIGRGGLLSTPAAANLVRTRGARGGFLLTASHNPGGPDGDFGIKFNTEGGGQASESLTDAIFRRTLEIERYHIVPAEPVDIDAPGQTRIGAMDIEVVDPVTDYAAQMESLFDFERIRGLFAEGFTMTFDAMHGVTGPYAREILENRLGAPDGTVRNSQPLADFGGRHPDPSPHDAAALHDEFMRRPALDFGAASDGDGDRNMLLTPGRMISPGDSLAILAANAASVPGYRDGIAGVARSMPTSRAVDRVARELGVPAHETPTGWRFFCNLLVAGRITLCGEESFGTGSRHVLEKDGLWAVLFWLNLIAETGKRPNAILDHHWERFGRDYFARHDYQIPDAEAAGRLIRELEDGFGALPGRTLGSLRVIEADRFDYEDPVDGSISRGQGLRVFFETGERAVYRLSGTGTRGATLRVYLERHMPPEGDLTADPRAMLEELGAAAAEIARIREITGLGEPTVVTA